MKVVHISTGDIIGGAPRAAYRQHEALQGAGVDSTMFVGFKASDDPTVIGARSGAGKFWRGLAARIDQWPRKLLRSANPLLSPAWLPTRAVAGALRLQPDVVNLQWACGGFVNIGSMTQLRRVPTVWTLHDMWAFCGMEHYSDDARWREGYGRGNRPEGERGFDLNRWTWARKRRAWTSPMQIVTPSRWLEDCVRRSALLREWPVTTIPYAIDPVRWRPADRAEARAMLGIPQDVRVVAFGATHGGGDRRKGFDLLHAALARLSRGMTGMRLAVIGGSRPENFPALGFPVHFLGRLHDDLSLRLFYSAVDAIVIPSRQDNLPNVGIEALACGTPVIAFEVGGLPDIAVHRETGWLAKAYDVEALAAGIEWVLTDEARLRVLRANARKRVEHYFNAAAVAAQYVALYERLMAERATASRRI